MRHDFVGARCLDRGDRVVEEAEWAGRVETGAIDREHDVFGYERLAVGELDPLPQLEGIGLEVGAHRVPGGQPRSEIAGGARYVQRLDDLVECVDVARDDCVGGVKRRWGDATGEFERPAPLDRGTLARARRRPRRRRGA